MRQEKLFGVSVSLTKGAHSNCTYHLRKYVPIASADEARGRFDARVQARGMKAEFSIPGYVHVVSVTDIVIVMTKKTPEGASRWPDPEN